MPVAVAERMSSPLYVRRTRKRRDCDAVASPFPSKSGLRPKVLLSSRRRSPGCEGYTSSGCASRASDLQTRVGGHFIPNCTYIHGCNANGRTPDAYDKPPPSTQYFSFSLSLSLFLNLSLFSPISLFPFFLSLRVAHLHTHVTYTVFVGGAHIRPHHISRVPRDVYT